MKTSNKPIEPGCLCMIVGYKNHPHNMGKIVTALEKVDSGCKGITMNKYQGGEGWRVAGEDLAVVWQTFDGQGISTGHSQTFVGEKHLMRLDDGEDIQTKKETSKELVTND